MSSASTLILVWLRPLRTISNSPAISLSDALICLNTPVWESVVKKSWSSLSNTRTMSTVTQ